MRVLLTIHSAKKKSSSWWGGFILHTHTDIYIWVEEYRTFLIVSHIHRNDDDDDNGGGIFARRALCVWNLNWTLFAYIKPLFFTRRDFSTLRTKVMYILCDLDSTPHSLRAPLDTRPQIELKPNGIPMYENVKGNKREWKKKNFFFVRRNCIWIVKHAAL